MNLRSMRHVWLSRAVTILRWTRASGYALIALTGVAAIVNPPPSVANATGSHLITYVWAGVMACSAGLCAAGAVLGQWPGEYAGLWPLAMVAAVFGISALARGSASVAGGLFLIGFFWMLVARWQEVALLRIESVRRHEELENEATA
jgi:hypothetical protein